MICAIKQIARYGLSPSVQSRAILAFPMNPDHWKRKWVSEVSYARLAAGELRRLCQSSVATLPLFMELRSSVIPHAENYGLAAPLVAPWRCRLALRWIQRIGNSNGIGDSDMGIGIVVEEVESNSDRLQEEEHLHSEDIYWLLQPPISSKISWPSQYDIGFVPNNMVVFSDDEVNLFSRSNSYACDFHSSGILVAEYCAGTSSRRIKKGRTKSTSLGNPIWLR